MPIPSGDASELEWLLFRQAGVITWSQASRLLSPARVRSRVASGRWQRPSRGILVTHSGRLERRQQLWVAVLAAGRVAVLAGLAAAREGGLQRVWSRRGDAIDVYVPATSRAPDLLRRLPAEMPAVFVHRTRCLPKQDRQRGLPTRTTIERSLVDAARWAITEEEARTIIAAGCQQKLASAADILEVVRRMGNLRRRSLIRETVLDLAGGAEALSEIDLARLCRQFGLPAPKHQQRRKDAAGRTRYLDAYWPEWHLHVEVDGAHHMEVAQWEADMRRQNDVWVQGDRILRFSSFQTRASAGGGGRTDPPSAAGERLVRVSCVHWLSISDNQCTQLGLEGVPRTGEPVIESTTYLSIGTLACILRIVGQSGGLPCTVAQPASRWRPPAAPSRCCWRPLRTPRQ